MQQFTAPQQHRLPHLQPQPLFIGGQRFSADDRDDIVGAGQLGEVDAEVVVGEGGGADMGDRTVGLEVEGRHLCGDQ